MAKKKGEAERRHLPSYKGREPEAFRLNFKGTAENLALDLDPDEDYVLIVRGKAKDPAFKTNQFGVLRLVESFDVDFAEVADEVTAERLMQEIKRREDQARGQESLDAEIDGSAEGNDD